MKYQILQGSEVIGISALEGRDDGMGVAVGRLTPTPAYERVRSTFRLFTEAEATKDHAKLEAYFSARDRLGLTLRSEGGTNIEATSIHIADYTDELDAEALEVEVHLASVEGLRKLDPVA